MLMAYVAMNKKTAYGEYELRNKENSWKNERNTVSRFGGAIQYIWKCSFF